MTYLNGLGFHSSWYSRVINTGNCTAAHYPDRNAEPHDRTKGLKIPRSFRTIGLTIFRDRRDAATTLITTLLPKLIGTVFWVLSAVEVARLLA